MSEPARSRRFEAEAAGKLLDAVDTEPAEGAWAAFNAAAIAVAFGDADLVRRMGDVARLILATEGLADTAKALAADARTALAEAMATGATTIKIETHTVSLADGKRGVVITDPSAIPPQFMCAPQPDKAAIGKALRAGEQVPGAALGNGGPPYLSFHRRDTVARKEPA